ncbi:MAG: hypothetical protein ABEJ05_09745 [Haloglomus sp.]
MYGVVTRNAEEVSWAEFDRAFYEVKDVTGRTADPVAGSTSMISCFGDNRVREENPELLPVSEDGARATREQKYFDWSYVCPSAREYRDQLLDRIESAVKVTEDLRLDDVGFPRPEYCHCDRCEAAFEDSPYDDWWRWRESVITGFVEEAREVVPGRLLMTLYPDPYPGHLSERAGIDPDALTPFVDEYVVPLYDMAYETTYWLEVIARGFQDALAAPFSIELYAVHIDHENLVQAADVAGTYAHSVLFAYDADAARRVITDLRESETDGTS